jgi:putative oxidoreductase
MKPLSGTSTRLIDTAILFLRLMTGIIFFVAGAGKVFGWFGGFGLKMTIGFYTQAHIPVFWAYVSCYTELIGGILLIIGLLTRVAALGLVINMIVAVLIVGWSNFFMPTGAVYAFTLLINALVILLTGPMRFSLDALLGQRRSQTKL